MITLGNPSQQTSIQTSPPQSDQQLDVHADADGPKPNEIDIRTGIPGLTAFEQIEKVDSLYYHEVTEGQYDFLDRAVSKGATLLSNTEMDVYFNTFSDKGYRFAVTSKDGETKYYRLTYIEPPISLENHHAFVLLYAPVDRITHEMTLRASPLPAADESYLSAAIAKPYRWTIVDAKSAESLQTLLADQGNVFTVYTERGNDTIQLMYIGPFSEELDMPEFQAMYNLTAANA